MNAPNTSSAVMQQRHEAANSLDDFPTPSWSTRALMEYVLKPSLGKADPYFKGLSCWEPCCGRGYMARPLQEYFGSVYTTDILNYGWPGQMATRDFLLPSLYTVKHDAIVFNPPFRLGAEFVLKAMEHKPLIIAAFVRSSFLEGGGRYRSIYAETPPTIVAHFVERVILHKGVVRDPSKKYWDPKAVNPKTGERTGWWRRPSTATSYAWLVWIASHERFPPMWIPPCRTKLEKPGDYE